MIEKLLRFIFGYVNVEINGMEIERFLNLIIAREINIWNIVSSDNKVCFCIKPKDTYKLKSIIEKMRKKPTMKDEKFIFNLRIKERYGLPFLLYAYRKRKMFFIGVFIGWLIVYILSGYIWNISFEGNMKHTDEELYRFLTSVNITEGIKKRNVKGEEIEKLLRNEYFDITWASAEITGTKLIIYVRENTNDLDEEKYHLDNEAGDLKASKSAEIVSVVTRAGTPVVKTGDIVNKGDILISEKVLLYRDDLTVLTEKFVRADGDVVGKVIYEIDEKIDRKYIRKEYTGRKYDEIISNIGESSVKARYEIRKNKFDKYDIVTNYSQMVIGESFYIPVYIEKKTYKEYVLADDLYTNEQLRQLASKKLMYKIKKIEENTIQISENNVKIEVNDEFCRIYGQVTVFEYIGVFGGTYE